MLQILSAIAALFLSVLLLMLSGGLQGSLVALRAALEGFSLELAGMMMSAYYAGLIAGTQLTGPLINRVGHIRAFAAFCGMNAGAVLLFPLFIDPWFWLLLRVFVGFNMAGLFMVIESWLNERGNAQTRGTLLSVYMGISYLAMGGGQWLLTAFPLATDRPFMLAALLAAAALVPVALTRATHPAPVEAASSFSFARLYRLSPTAVIGCVCSGLMTGAMFGVGPIFARRLGLDIDQTALFMGVLMLSGLLFQLPMGRLSDRIDRRWVISGAAIVAMLAALAIIPIVDHYSFTTLDASMQTVSIMWLPNAAWLLVMVAITGGMVATIYPLSVAHANDHIPAGDMVQASGGLVLAFGCGAVLGSPLAAEVMKPLGAVGLFVYLALVAALTALAVAWRKFSGPPVTAVDKEAFVVMPEVGATPAVAEIDPRAEHDDAP